MVRNLKKGAQLWRLKLCLCSSGQSSVKQYGKEEPSEEQPKRRES